MTIDKYLTGIEDLSNRLIAITGASSGLGLNTAKHLLKKNARLVFLCRNEEKTKKVIDELKVDYPNAQIDFINYNQSSFELIEKGIDELLNRFPNVDTICLNAGVLKKSGKTLDGYPDTFGINYLGVRHFIEYLSTKEIDHRLKLIIQGSLVSSAHISKKLDPYSQKYSAFTQYNFSKGYLEAYIYYLFINKIYSNFDFVISEPGVSHTQIIRNLPKWMIGGAKWFMPIFFHSPKKASLTMVKAVSEDSFNGDLIVPRGLFTINGFPKKRKFPNKRKRLYLFEKK